MRGEDDASIPPPPVDLALEPGIVKEGETSHQIAHGTEGFMWAAGADPPFKIPIA